MGRFDYFLYIIVVNKGLGLVFHFLVLDTIMRYLLFYSYYLYYLDQQLGDGKSPLGAPIVLQRKGTCFGASMPMITELVNDSNVQVGNFSNKILNISYTKYSVTICTHT